jgi:hypothetical protein
MAVMVRRVLIGFLYFGAVSAVAGGVLGAVANGAGVPLSYLDSSPFSSFLVPGLVLGAIVGGTQLSAAIALTIGRGSPLVLSVIAGFGMLIWIFVELAVIGEYSWLQTVYFALGSLELAAVFTLLGLIPRLVSAVQPLPTEGGHR